MEKGKRRVTTKNPTFGSLFAGIGGFDLGLERAGWECHWQVEIDDFCQKVLTKHWPDVPKFRDIKAIKGDELEPVDLICGGFPCQPFSVAGKQRGKKDDRYLWPEMLRIVEAVRPTWFLGENVPGIIKLALDNVLADLEALGYSTRTFVIPACALNAPHRRDRVWIVAYSDNVRQPPERVLWPVAISEAREGKEHKLGDESEDVADTPSKRQRPGANQSGQDTRAGKFVEGSTPRSDPINNGEALANAQNADRWGTGRKENSRWRDSETRRRCESICGVQHWSLEPDVGRVAHGVSSRVDRLKSLGNAVVPQVAEAIGRMILEAWEK